VSDDLPRCWWLVDPGGDGQLGRDGRAVHEPFGLAGIGVVEYLSPGGVQCGGVAVMDGLGGHQSDPGMAVLMVIPVHELAAVPPGVLDVVKAGGERRPVLQRFEPRFGVRVI
jgi:hypothetical protein